MAVVWTFNVPNAGTRRVFSIEDRIWDGQRTSVSATVGGTLGTSRGVLRQIRTRGGGLGDDFKAASLQRHFWVRNAPYAVKDRGNPLKSQQMRAPSERTINPRLALKSLRFFPDVTRESYHSVPVRRSPAVRLRQLQKVIE